MKIFSSVVPALIMCACASAVVDARAEYPERPVRYIVPSAAGGGADISARLLVSELSAQFKQQFVVDNRPGSVGTIGIQLLMQARPDGYTLGYGNVPSLAINSALVPDLPYDPERDLTLIGQFTTNQNLLVVRNSLSVRSVQELINYARTNPDKLTYASSGNGTTLHLSGELFKQMTGTRIVHVPYKAVVQALTDMMGGQIDLIFDNQSSIASYVTSQRLRALAVTGPKRSARFPDIPTLNEAGVKGYEITTWTAMIGPKGLQKGIVTQLSAEIARACISPRVQTVLTAQGASCATGSPEQFAQFVKKERAKWGDIVRKSSAKVD